MHACVLLDLFAVGPPGYYYDVGTNALIACPTGTYKSTYDRATACTSCGAGTSSAPRTSAGDCGECQVQPTSEARCCNIRVLKVCRSLCVFAAHRESQYMHLWGTLRVLMAYSRLHIRCGMFLQHVLLMLGNQFVMQPIALAYSPFQVWWV